jgi:hypothetical protein
MVTKYCEFQPTQHKNKRPAAFVFLDDENDKHPMPICDVCAVKLKQMLPNAIVRSAAEMKKQAPGGGAGKPQS